MHIVPIARRVKLVIKLVMVREKTDLTLRGNGSGG
jgi:hypothetical protein